MKNCLLPLRMGYSASKRDESFENNIEFYFRNRNCISISILGKSTYLKDAIPEEGFIPALPILTLFLF